MFTYTDLHTAAARLGALPVMPCVAVSGVVVFADMRATARKTIAPTNDAQGSPPRGEPC